MYIHTQASNVFGVHVTLNGQNHILRQKKYRLDDNNVNAKGGSGNLRI